MSDSTEQLQAIWVREPPRLDGPVQLADYDPTWPAAFEREAARVRKALGPAALLVEHVGSTSVPGLAAKPRIDILLAVEEILARAGAPPRNDDEVEASQAARAS